MDYDESSLLAGATVKPEPVCPCVSRHTPQPRSFDKHHVLPQSWGGPDDDDNYLTLCPTAHRNIHSLLDRYVKYRGAPPEHELARFSKFTRKYAAEGVARFRALNGGAWPNRYALHFGDDPAMLAQGEVHTH